ncbi:MULTISPECIES: PepSY-like domain-containing protein [unclassified Myroides]|uniref:PepSY-like domain-containing protein n=1 Tax=unclassified Myroides TaxID=2642485 RepID=UPI003D2F983C
MRKLKTILVGVFSMATLFFSETTQAKDIIITKNELPQKALMFMDTHFKGKEIQTIEKDDDFLSVSYKVTFADRLEIEFDRSGEWDEVDGNGTALPTSFMLDPIVAYVKQQYKETAIVKIEKKRSYYEVELQNGLELEFSKSGTFKRIDH